MGRWRLDKPFDSASGLQHLAQLLMPCLAQYPYPVDEVIMFFADHCDLILVFFDPIGQVRNAAACDAGELCVLMLRCLPGAVRADDGGS